MSLLLLSQIVFAIGVGVYLTINHATIKEVARWAGGIAGILYGLILLLGS